MMKTNLIFSIALLLIVTVIACNNKNEGASTATKDQTSMMGTSMTGDTTMMRNMMKDPAMMQSMMTMMMEQCEKDTAICRTMCINMMKSPRMKAMMRDMMKGDRMNMNIENMDDMKGMNMDKKSNKEQ